MQRLLGTALGLVVIAIAAIFTALVLEGGTVRTPASTGREAAATAARPQHPGPPPPKHLAPGISIAAVGDTMLGNTPELPADPGTYLDAVRGQLKGDAVFGNLEGTLTDLTDSPKCGGAPSGTCFAFRTPPSYARHLAAAGFTVTGEMGEQER